MRVTVYKPAVCFWNGNKSYREIAGSRRIGSVSYYSEEFDSYLSLIREVLQANRNNGIEIEKVRNALVCGFGRSSEEISLMTELFPNLAEVHVVDWHEPHVDDIVKKIKNDGKPDNLRVIVHLTDIRAPEATFPNQEIDFAFANKVFDLFERDDLSTLSLLAGIATALKPGGVFHSFDYPMPFADGRKFYSLAKYAGMEKVDNRLLVRLKPG